jgi:UDP-N-acetylmuramoyl-L-alanyl-D-glutamate--2,6-diaminopimelate ligase
LRLIDLLKGDSVEVTVAVDPARMEIAGLTSDSRQVKPGFLFAALPGGHFDGRDFIAGAVERGAVAILAPPGAGDRAPAAGLDRRRIALIVDENPRRRFALMAARFFSQQPSTVAAVTGTNGKTSVVWFLRQIWAGLGHKAASLGTLGVQAPGLNMSGRLTTPDPVQLHRTLARLKLAGVDHLAMEASSHGLAQHRLDGVRIAAAGFTNLSRDHLDYHGSVDAYLAAKTRLFSELLADGGSAVVNADAPNAPAIQAAAERRGVRVLTFGTRGRDIRLDGIEPVDGGQRLTVTLGGETTQVTLPLVGDFQAWNALCALGLAVATGAGERGALATLETLRGVPGRLELVARLKSGASVYVDYAHTPDALASVLGALRPRTRGALAVVFGCGGDRDPGKRSEMGRIAAELADRAVVTDDNPRGEIAADIRRQVLAACPGGVEIGDRAEAIAHAMSELRADDVLVIAGKGHETGQTVGERVLPFDDTEVARAVAEELDR